MPDINIEPGSFREQSEGTWGTLDMGVQQLSTENLTSLYLLLLLLCYLK